jgi:hypothetical protein
LAEEYDIIGNEISLIESRFPGGKVPVRHPVVSELLEAIRNKEEAVPHFHISHLESNLRLTHG